MSEPSSPPPLPARILVSLTALPTGLGPFLADWNETHIFNPHWPPHAKFHNAQTMLFGATLALATLLFAWQKGPHARPYFHAALTFATLYWVTQVASILFPGTNWIDPDRPVAGTQWLGLPLQLVLSTVLLSLVGAAAIWRRRRSHEVH